MRRALLCFPLTCLILASGCQKINFDQTLTIGKGDHYAEVEFKAPSSDRTVRVTAECDTPVTVYAVLMDYKADAVSALLRKKSLLQKLGGEENTKEASFEAEVPAGKGFVILVVPVKKPEKEIEVKLTAKARER
jgi:hypothetical protein